MTRSSFRWVRFSCQVCAGLGWSFGWHYGLIMPTFGTGALLVGMLTAAYVAGCASEAERSAS